MTGAVDREGETLYGLLEGKEYFGDIEGHLEVERGVDGKGSKREWRLKSVLGTCSRGPMRNLVEDGEACCSFVS